MRTYKLFIIILLLFSCTIASADPSKSLTLGVFAYRPEAIMLKRYQPLVDYLNSRLQHTRIKLRILQLNEIGTALADKQLDFIFTNPRHYIILRQQYQLNGAIATLIKQSDSGLATNKLGGVIFTRSSTDSINQLSDLEGRSIAIPGTKYLGGYQTQAYELLQAGIKLPDDAQLIIAGQHDKVVHSVLSGKADAGFVRTEILENMSSNGDFTLSEVKILNPQKLKHFPFISSTRLYPEWPVVALPHVELKTVSHIASALLAIKDDDPALKKTSIAGFAPPSDYLLVEEIARELRLPPYDKTPDFTLLDIWTRHKKNLFVLIFFLGIISLLLLRLLYRNRIIINQQQQLKEQTMHTRQIIDATQVGTWEWNVQTGETIFNERWAEMLGYTLQELSPVSIKTWENLTHPDDLIIAKQQLQAHFDGKSSFYAVDFRMKHKTGQWLWINDRGKTSKWTQGGKPLWMSGTHTDINERVEKEQQLRLAATVFSNSQEGILISDKNNCIVDINPACLMLSGYLREEIIGKTPALFNSGIQTKEFYQQMWQSITTDGHWHGDIWNRKKTGEVYSERLSIDAVYDNNDRLQNYVAIFFDISYLKKHEAELEQIAYNDPLTGLPNRLLLRDRMQQTIAKTKRNETLLAVCFLDIDGFKPVNDRFGHKVGDIILIEIAQRLQQVIRTEDTVARIGGDEFVVLIQDLNNISELKQILDRTLESISSRYTISKDASSNYSLPHIESISASIGVTLFPLDESEADRLLRHADQAMYIAKQQGKNCYSFFDASEDKRLTLEHKIQQEVKTALNEQQFILFYQPKVNMHTGEVVGVEALIRWQHPERGLLLPAQFLPAIEHSPLIIDMGNWVLRQAFLQLRQWQSQGIHLVVSVNIDAAQLQQGNFVSLLEDLLTEFNDIPASQLELEILENTALHDITHISDIIKQCNQLGIQFSLDDFGTGYSSLTYLKHLPASILKIDQSFIRNLLASSDDMTIIEGILGLAHAFHRTPIAEGVESIQIGTLLLNLGCQLAQGYAIARPMPEEDIALWLDTYRIPRQWQEASHFLSFDADYTLTLMCLNHQRIITRVHHAVEQWSASLIPEHFFNRNTCELGQWISDEGREKYGHYKEFEQAADKHKEIHQLIKTIAELINQNEHEAVRFNSDRLTILSNETIDCLNSLQNNKELT